MNDSSLIPHQIPKSIYVIVHLSHKTNNTARSKIKFFNYVKLVMLVILCLESLVFSTDN